jgi:PAS domain S-box-containing protein
MADSIQHTDRRQLQQIIVGLTEGIILINPDQAIAWANDTALTMHGVGSVEELGSTVSDYRDRFELRYRNRHKLPPGDYPMDRVVSGEQFTGVIVEVGRPGEEKRWVHQVRSLVLTNTEGQPDCLVLVVQDETERFRAENRFEQGFSANPAPALIVRLSDMRYVKVNQGYLEMTGYPRGMLIGRSMHERDILEGAENRDLAVERLHSGTTIPQMEARLKLPEGAEKLVLLAGQPLEVGDEACMLFTFADLQPRKLAEDALRQSEERFAKAFRMAPGPMAIIALDGLRVLDVNDAFTAATGWPREEVVGRGEAELALWGCGEARDKLVQQLRQTGHLQTVDIRLRTLNGGAGDYVLSAETVTIHQERCVLTVMLDITERKQTEIELLAAIDSVMHDTSWFGQKIVERLANLAHSAGPARPGPEIASLTARAREVLGLVAQGLSDDEIAAKLGVTRNTVRNHLSAIYGKLGVHRRSAVVIWARERGLGARAKPPIRRNKPRYRRLS